MLTRSIIIYLKKVKQTKTKKKGKKKMTYIGLCIFLVVHWALWVQSLLWGSASNVTKSNVNKLRSMLRAFIILNGYVAMIGSYMDYFN